MESPSDVSSDAPLVTRNVSAPSSSSNNNEAPTDDAIKERVVAVKNGHVVLERNEDGDEVPFVGNSIRTSKYTMISFLPINLFEQLSRPANFYFLCIAALQAIKPVSISQGKPTILLPLLFVLFVGGLKDAFEDYKRHVDDARENRREYERLNVETQQFEKTPSFALQVGDFVKVYDDQVYPADILLLFASSKGGYSYVETANLDGETNLKIKMVPEGARHIQDHTQLSKLHITVTCDAPNGKLDAFGGSIRAGEEKIQPLSLDNVLLRASKLRNTGYILGLIVYTGEETKIRMNSSAKKTSTVKRSSVEKTMNKQIFGMFLAQVTVCTLAGIGAGSWTATHISEVPYLDLSDSAGVIGLIRFFTWFIIFAGFVPISLLVSMEMVKFLQGQYMGWDIEMAYLVENEWQFARAQTSGLNEELGQIQFVLSDKTGTLTCNRMDFRKCVVGPIQYGSGDTDISKAAKQRQLAELPEEDAAEMSRRLERTASMVAEDNKVEISPHVNFNARVRFQNALESKLSKYRSQYFPDMYNSEKAPEESKDTGGKIIHSNRNLEEEFLLSLALGNTVFPTQEAGNDEVVLKASSPDEEALVEFARFMGYELFKRDPPHIALRITIGTNEPRIVQFEQVALLDFTSKRKRMTVIVRTPHDTILVLSKGADNMMSMLLKDNATDHQFYDITMDTLEHLGDQGLRTLLVASAEKEASWWDDPDNGWGAKYAAVMEECMIEGPEEVGHFKGGCSDKCRRCRVEEDIEAAAGLELVGATAIEDKLQDNVPETIRALLVGGMSVWVLTGDKLETAINIGMACNLLESSMEPKGNLFRIEGSEPDEVRGEIDRIYVHIREAQAKKLKDPFGLVLTSSAFAAILEGGDELVARFWSVATQCKSVVGCRMQPNQKARIVSLVKELSPKGVSTLAVGDGANDEQMIRTADVGVGIRGVEGTTAVRASDYAISQFSFLRRLLFVHGRLSYYRVAVLILYIFYKNALICLTQFWFGIFSGFSGQPIFLEWAYQLYNVAFTALPILVFAVLDRDIPFEDLHKYPVIYSYTSDGQLFNKKIFWQWMGLSLIHSIVIFTFPFVSFNSTSNSNSGQSDGMWSVGVVIYTSVVLVTNLKLALIFRSWTWVHHLVMWGTIVFYFLAMIILNLSPVFSTAGGDYTWLVFRLLGTPKFYFTLILTVGTALLFDFTLESYMQLEVAPRTRGSYKPPSVPKRTERNSLPPTAVVVPKIAIPKDRKLIRRHTGFDFSHTAGQGQRLGYRF